MFKTFIAIFAFTLSSALLACSASNCKTEVELKINLTKKGYDQLKSTFANKFQGEKADRTDYYFDIFQNGSYYLKRTIPPMKLRFQKDGSDVKWQAQKTVSSVVDSIFSVKTTDAITMELKNDGSLFEAIESYHSYLNNTDPYALVIAGQIQDALSQTSILNFTRTLCTACDPAAKYFSTHMNNKKRVKIKLKLSDDDQFSVQVGETNNRGIVTYELEAEIKKSSNLHKSAERLKTWLFAQGFELSHMDITPAMDVTLTSEAQLQKLTQTLRTQY